MNEMPTKLKDRFARKNAKRVEKKTQIAESALQALKELGYANTSLRDIAAKSDLSLGMLHYYFEDKVDLIVFCIEIYKRDFIGKIQKDVAGASSREEVIEHFSQTLGASVLDDEMIHRLWYDFRTQALFDETFRPVVDETEAMLIDSVRMAFVKSGKEPPADASIYYAMIDGTFRYLMQSQISLNPRPREDAVKAFHKLLSSIL